MKNLATLVFFILVFLSCSVPKETEIPPNIIYFLADGLGYGEVGVYGQQKIQIPNAILILKWY